MRPKSTGHAVGSLVLVAIAAFIDDIAWFAPTVRAHPLSAGWEIAIWIVAVTATIAFLWMAYEQWFGRL